MFDGTGDCQLFHKEFDKCMKANSLGGVISLDNNSKMEFFLEKCEKVFAAYKGALSQSIRQYLESTFMHLYNDATKENIEQLKNAVQNRYGGWNDVKGQQNYDSMMAIPNFLDVDSVDKGLFELQRLMTEREGWKRPDQKLLLCLRLHGPIRIPHLLLTRIRGLKLRVLQLKSCLLLSLRQLTVSTLLLM